MDYSDENLESRWYREHSHRLHKIRLQGIKERSPIISQSPGRYNSVSRRRPNFDPIKYQDFYRENKILYEKLSQISERKASPYTSTIPKSLNLQKRKKEAKRIVNANLNFLKRLTEKDSFVSARKHKEEYAVMEKYKKSISKANLQERLKKIALGEFKLPPIASMVLNISEKSKTEGCNKIINSVNEENHKVKLRKMFSEQIKNDEEVKENLPDGKRFEVEVKDVEMLDKEKWDFEEGKDDDEGLMMENCGVEENKGKEDDEMLRKDKSDNCFGEGTEGDDKEEIEKIGSDKEKIEEIGGDKEEIEEIRNAPESALLSLEISNDAKLPVYEDNE